MYTWRLSYQPQGGRSIAKLRLNRKGTRLLRAFDSVYNRKRLFLAILSMLAIRYHFRRPAIDSHGKFKKNELVVVDITACAWTFRPSLTSCKHNGIVRWYTKLDEVEKPDLYAFHLNNMPPKIARKMLSTPKLAFILEAPPHSVQHPIWGMCEFGVTYDLDESFPQPHTYFPANYSRSLLRNEASQRDGVVWLCSNCDATNKRQLFTKELMRYLKVDSYGNCLRNKPQYVGSPPRLYRKYKFVIAIENCNCKDYVTEKFVHAIEAGAVPIVAAAEGKPDYLRFAPKNSFLNIYDFPDVKSVAEHINRSLADEMSYREQYLKYKDQPNIKNWDRMNDEDLTKWARTKRFANEAFSKEILLKETGEDFYCKMLTYFRSLKDLNFSGGRRNFRRATEDEVCLHRDLLPEYFDLGH